MVNKRYMRKCDTCVGHEARINKLLLKKPPGIMSVDSTSSVCEPSADEPPKARERRIEKKGGRIVSLRVPFPGRHALKCMSGLRKKQKNIWGSINE